MIKKAVIAAAGNGTRFLPVTKAYPKELLPILNKPIIQLLVEEMVAAGLEKILIIHQHGNPLIKRYFSPHQKLEGYLKKVGKEDFLASLEKFAGKLLFCPQPRRLPYGTSSPVLAAKKFVGQDPFVYLYGDDLILEKKAGQFISQLISTFEKYQPAAVIGVQQVPWDEVERYGSVRYKKDSKIPYQIESVEERLPAGRAPSNCVQLGRFVVSPKIFPILAKQNLSSFNELFFTDALKTLAKTEVVIAQPIKKGQWLTTGDPERWLKANQEFQKAFS